MRFTRRQFVRGGVSAFTFGFAAPQFLSELALAQGGGARNLVVVYLNGGNDALSTLVPYGDADYYARRPTIARARGRRCSRSAPIAAATCSGLHPSLAGLKAIFDGGKLAVVQRTGYQNSSRSHFQGFDIWGTANPADATGPGWLGRYLDTLPSPIDPLVGWNTSRETPRALMARTVGVPAITNPATYSFASPNVGAEAGFERAAAVRISSHLPADRPHLAFVNSTAQAALGTLDRVATVATYRPSLAYPNNGFAQALQAVAGAMYPADRHQGVLGGHRRLRHARQPEPGERRLPQPHGHGRRRTDRVQHRSAQPGAARLHAGARLLGVRPPHHRERQPGHRPRRRRDHDGDGRPGARRASTARRPSCATTPRTPTSRTPPATCGTRPTSDRSTPACSTTGWARTRCRSSARTSEPGRRRFSRRGWGSGLGGWR